MALVELLVTGVLGKGLSVAGVSSSSQAIPSLSLSSSELYPASSSCILVKPLAAASEQFSKVVRSVVVNLREVSVVELSLVVVVASSVNARFAGVSLEEGGVSVDVAAATELPELARTSIPARADAATRARLPATIACFPTSSFIPLRFS